MTLSQLSAGLLFLHGHITDPALAATLAAAEHRPTPRLRSPVMDLFKSLMYLGGRPMHSGHNLDLDEPFEPRFGNRVASQRAFRRPASRGDERAARAPLSPAPCGQGCG